MRKRIHGVLLVSALLVIGCPGGDEASTPSADGGQSEGGQPEGGQPEGGQPEGGQPEGGQPEGGQPEGGQPDATRPLAAGELGYSGQFEGDGLSIKLAGRRSVFAGSLSLRGGASYPVTAGVDATGALSGSFRTGNKTFSLEATLEGDVMTLTSSNKTYTLQRLPQDNVLADWALGTGTDPLRSLTGVYLGELYGEPAALEVSEDDVTVKGTLVAGDQSYALEGTRSAVAASGSLEDAQGSRTYGFELVPTKGGVFLSLVTGEGEGERRLTAVLKKAE